MENHTTHRDARRLPDDERNKLIKFTELNPSGSTKLIFSSTKKFSVQRILDFVENHLPEHKVSVLWVPPGKDTDGEWMAHVEWGRKLIRLQASTRFHTIWYKDSPEAAWRVIAYNKAWRACSIAQDLYGGVEWACKECGMEARPCAESWLYPVVEEAVGEPYSEESDTWKTLDLTAWYSGRRVTTYAAEIQEPGFVYFPPRTVRADLDDAFFPRDNWVSANDVDLSWDNVDAVVDADSEKAIRGGQTRKRHNECCGYKKERCVFRDKGCPRWGTWDESHRTCTRRWLSREDAVAAGLERYEAYHDGPVPRRDLQVAHLLAGHSFDARLPETGRMRQHVYRGVVSAGRGDHVLHEFVVHHSWGKAEKAFQGTWMEALQYIRRNGPDEYEHGWNTAWQCARKVELPDELALMMLEVAEHDFYDGRRISSVSVSKWRPYAYYGQPPKDPQWTLTLHAQSRNQTFWDVGDVLLDLKLTGWSRRWGGWVPS